MSQPSTSVRDKLDGPILLVLARLVLPTFTVAFLGFAGYIGKHVIEVMDIHTKQLNEIHVSIAARDMFITDITRQRDGEIKSIREAWADHEQRLRTLSDRIATRNQR